MLDLNELRNRLTVSVRVFDETEKRGILLTVEERDHLVRLAEGRDRKNWHADELFRGECERYQRKLSDLQVERDVLRTELNHVRGELAKTLAELEKVTKRYGSLSAEVYNLARAADRIRNNKALGL